MARTDSWVSALGDAPKQEFTSDEESWLGLGSDAPAEQTAARTAAKMAAKTSAIRPFPKAATRVIELTGKPELHVREVVRVIETDTTLATRILRYVNSAACGLKVRCKSLYHAVTLLGPRRIRELVTSTAVLSMFERGDDVTTDILEHAAMTGALSRLVGERYGLPSEEMLACGLLHDLGKLMMIDGGDEYYPALLELAGDDETLCKLERDQYGYDHAVLAGQMLIKWHIPAPIPRVVSWHHQPGRAHRMGGRVALMVEVLRFADQVADAIQTLRPEDSVRALIDRLAETTTATYLNLGSDVLARMWPTLDRTARDSRALFHNDEVPLSELEPLEVQRARALEAPVEAKQPDLHCAICNEPTYGAQCGGCQRPVCDAHDPGMGFCPDCEEAFANERDPLTIAATGTLAIGGGAAGLLLAFSAFMDVDVSLALAATFATSAVAGTAAAVRRWARRRAFRPAFADVGAGVATAAPTLKTAIVRATEFEAPMVAAQALDPDGKRVFRAADLSALVPTPKPLYASNDDEFESIEEFTDDDEVFEHEELFQPIPNFQPRLAAVAIVPAPMSSDSLPAAEQVASLGLGLSALESGSRFDAASDFDDYYGDESEYEPADPDQDFQLVDPSELIESLRPRGSMGPRASLPRSSVQPRARNVQYDLEAAAVGFDVLRDRDAASDMTRELRDDVEPSTESLLTRVSASVPYSERAWAEATLAMPMLRSAAHAAPSTTLVPESSEVPKLGFDGEEGRDDLAASDTNALIDRVPRTSCARPKGTRSRDLARVG